MDATKSRQDSRNPAGKDSSCCRWPLQKLIRWSHLNYIPHGHCVCLNGNMPPLQMNGWWWQFHCRPAFHLAKAIGLVFHLLVGFCFIFTSKNATMMAPTMTKAELRTAQRMREMDSPPGSVNFSISGKTLRKVLQKQLQHIHNDFKRNFHSQPPLVWYEWMSETP